MASPTWAEKWTQIRNAINILHRNRLRGSDATYDATNMVAQLDTHHQSVEGDYAGSAAVALDRLRADYAALAGSNRVRQVIDPHLFDLGKVISSPATSIPRLLKDLYRYMIDNSESVNSRNLTFGAVAAAGGNTGNGTIYRLTADEDGHPIEAVHLDTVTTKATQDQNTGTDRGREVLEIYHGDPGPDELEIRGSAVIASLTGLAGDELLQNASFGQLDGTAADPTSIPSWDFTAGAVTNVQLSTTTYRNSPEEGSTAYSLLVEAAANVSIRQRLRVIGRELDRDVPYLLLARYNTQGSGRTGTLTIRYGTTNAAVTFTGAEGAGWNTLVLTRNNLLWPRRAQEEDLDISIEAAGAGAGTLLIDDVVFAPGTKFDNLWYWAVGGSTHWVLDDRYTFADSLTATDAILQQWFWRGYNVWLPSNNAGLETVVDP